MTGELVVDASVVVKWFVREDGSDDARELAESGVRLVAPALINLEVASALSRKSRNKLMSLDEIEASLRQLPRLFDEIIGLDALMRPALALANRLDHPIYDCLYVEAARHRQVGLVTSDLGLLRKVAPLGGVGAVALANWTAALA